MTTFPVIASTISATALGQFVKEKYNLDENCTCKLFRTGINHTYLISSGDTKYALRVYSHNWRSESDIQEEIDLLNLLKNNSISISFPIADTEGNFIQTLNAPEGMRYAVLFSFAEGEKIRVMDKETCFSIGSLMAAMHNVTQNKKSGRINYNSATLLKEPYKQAVTFFSEELPEMKFLKQQSEEISSFFEQDGLKDIPQGIVHLDIWYDNMSIKDTDEITLFDFDFCGSGWLMMDVAYFCTQLFHIETNKEEYEIKLQSFLSGYQSIRELSEDELNLIPKAGTAIWIFYLGIQVRRYDWSNVFLSENYLKLLFAARIKSWVEYYETKKIKR